MVQRKDNSRNAFINIGTIGWGLIISSICLLSLGLILAWLPKQFKYERSSYLYNLCLTLSPALIASSVLTMTLEYANAFQRRKDFNIAINEMRDIAIESILRDFVGDNDVLNEIKTYIFNQSYIRKNFNVSMNLRWDDTVTQLLKKEMTLSYSIYNISAGKITYIFRAIEEKQNETNHSGTTKITSMSYEIKDNQTNSSIDRQTYNETQISTWNWGRYKNNSAIVSGEIEVVIPPDSYGEFKFTSTCLLNPEISYPVISLTSTSDMNVDVYYPFDIFVSSLGIHPDPEKFKLDVNETTHKRWKTRGLLPGQGISVSLSKNSGSISSIDSRSLD